MAAIVVLIARTALNMVNIVVAIARTALKMVTIFVEIARMAVIMVGMKTVHIMQTWIIVCIVCHSRRILIVTDCIVEILEWP